MTTLRVRPTRRRIERTTTPRTGTDPAPVAGRSAVPFGAQRAAS
jgi:hypothetical protein